jgi:hypothetical protein
MKKCAMALASLGAMVLSLSGCQLFFPLPDIAVADELLMSATSSARGGSLPTLALRCSVCRQARFSTIVPGRQRWARSLLVLSKPTP